MKKESPFWSSISLLIGIVIAILALIRGRMRLPLLLAVFALWLLWWLLTQALPLWRNNRAYDCIASRCRQIRTQKEYPAKTLRGMCNSYGWGFCRGLSAAFQKQEAEHQEWGLVMVVPQAVEDAVSKMKRSSYKISSTSSMNRQYAAMGYADGQEFDMRRRLEPSA